MVVSDSWNRTIPNPIPILTIILFIFAAFYSPTAIDWGLHFAAGAIVLVIGMLLFYFNLIGGGDAKALSSVCVWTGFDVLPNYLLAVALIGGALSLLFLLLRWITVTIGSISKSEKIQRNASSWAAKCQELPYGVAIGLGGIYVSREFFQWPLML